jgi:hypothetical protein
VKDLLLKNRRIALHEVAHMLEIAFGSVQGYIERQSEHLLSEEQGQDNVIMCWGMRLQREPEFISEIITNNEIWLYGCA